MLHVLPLLLRIVIGEVVGALAELVVAASVLVAVVVDAAGERGRGGQVRVGLVAVVGEGVEVGGVVGVDGDAVLGLVGGVGGVLRGLGGGGDLFGG